MVSHDVGHVFVPHPKRDPQAYLRLMCSAKMAVLCQVTNNILQSSLLESEVIEHDALPYSRGSEHQAVVLRKTLERYVPEARTYLLAG